MDRGHHPAGRTQRTETHRKSPRELLAVPRRGFSLGALFIRLPATGVVS